MRTLCPCSIDADVEALLQQVLITPAELMEIVGLIANSVMLNLAPAWMWQLGDVDAQRRVQFWTGARARRLAEPRRRAAFLRFADLVDQLGEPAAVRWLPPLPLGRPVEDHLIEWFEKSREFLVSIPVGSAHASLPGRSVGRGRRQRCWRMQRRSSACSKRWSGDG